MRKPHNSHHRGNATVIALLALVTAVLALLIALLALFSGGRRTAEVAVEPPRSAPTVVSPLATNPTPESAVKPEAKPAEPKIVEDVKKPDAVEPTVEADATDATSSETLSNGGAQDGMASESVATEGEEEPDRTPGLLDDAPVRAPKPVAAVKPAGRSAIPEEGETITKPLAAERLADGETEPAPEGVIAWAEAGQHVGQTVTARGEVVNTNNIGDLTFLNFDTDWQDKFYVVVFRDAYDGIPGGNPELAYLHQTIEVTGEVTTHRGRPQIQVRDASQIKLVDK